MTTIAYRNGIMAGDRRVTNHNIIEPDVTKIFKRDSDGALIGAAGTLGLATRFTRWFLAGEKGEPPELFDKDGGCEAEAIIVRPNCHPETHYRYGVIHLESDYYAIGSGSCAALTALDLGFSAIEAVDAAARRDTGTGPKHDVLHLGAAISALTPPLQHKGGETEVGDKLGEFMKLDGAVKWDASKSGNKCPIDDGALVEVLLHDGDVSGPSVAELFDWGANSFQPDHDIIAYRIISSSEADSGPRSEAPAGDARVEPLQVLDAEPSPILRSDVPPAAETFAAPSGDEFATINGQTRLIVSDEQEAQGHAQTLPEAAYSHINEVEDRYVPEKHDPEAAGWLRMFTGKREVVS